MLAAQLNEACHLRLVERDEGQVREVGRDRLAVMKHLDHVERYVGEARKQLKSGMYGKAMRFAELAAGSARTAGDLSGKLARAGRGRSERDWRA